MRRDDWLGLLECGFQCGLQKAQRTVAGLSLFVPVRVQVRARL